MFISIIWRKANNWHFAWNNYNKIIIETKRFPSSVPNMRCYDMLSMILVIITAKFTVKFLND